MADSNNNDEVIDNGVDLNIDQNASEQEQNELLKEMGVGQPKNDDDDGAEEVDLDELEERAGRVDEELEGAHTEAEREAIRAERRNKKAERRQRARDRTEQLQREVQSERQQRQALEQRLARLEGNERGAQLGHIEQTEQRMDSAIEQLRDVIADATAKQDGKTVALATQRMLEAIEAKKDIARQKQAMQQSIQQANKPSPTVDPVLAKNTLTWAQRNSWYRGPNSAEPDSKVLTALDNAVAAAGFDPRTQEYWDELDAQVKKYLPHRVQQRDNPRTVNTGTTTVNRPQRSPVAGSGNNGNEGAGGNAARNTFRLSGERVKAMKESGAWFDPKRKADMIKSYREFDAREAARNGR